MAGLSFIEICKNVPVVCVFDNNGADELVAQDYDQKVYDTRSNDNFIEGDGSYENPYQYAVASAASPHYAIIDLWIRFRHLPCFIKVNNWTLKIVPKGVVAMNGCFTRFIW